MHLYIVNKPHTLKPKQVKENEKCRRGNSFASKIPILARLLIRFYEEMKQLHSKTQIKKS